MTLLKTENLVILFTDIVGFTESTALQSREQNRRILDRHNSLLLPIVKRFQGRHIKSIGDALLLAFTSPTDGMRCAMAMQDGMHDYNLTAPPGEEIHIRVAASLGEVRVTKSDIFGEPVNVTSRIEGITPADEIYFSEAVYLAMNKAEVPALEIGLKELKGIPKPVRIFAIPRFAQTRLVTETSSEAPADPRVSFPYGGMHLTNKPSRANWRSVVGGDGRPVAVSPQLAGVIGGAVIVIGVSCFLMLGGGTGSRTTVASVIPVVPTRAPTATVPPPAATATPRPIVTIASLYFNGSTDPVATLPALLPSSQEPPFRTPTGQVSALRAPLADTRPAPAAPTNKVKTQSPKAVRAPKAPAITTIIGAKQAYRAGRIDKVTYKQIVDRLDEEFEQRVRQTKLDYKAGKFSKEEYRRRIIALRLRYIGED